MSRDTGYRINGRVVTRTEFLRRTRGCPKGGDKLAQEAGDVERRMYGTMQKPIIDHGLRVKIYGKSDRKRKMEDRARRNKFDKVECVG